MAGVVRRDGLREEAARALANANNGGLTEHEPDEGDYYLLDKVLRILGLDAVPDVPPTEDDWREANCYYEDDPGLLPDVPPDPPTADRDELTDLLDEARDLLEAEYDADTMSDAQLDAWRAADKGLFAALQDCRRYANERDRRTT